MWSIWKERNLKIFENKASEEREVFESPKWRLCAWLAANKKFRGTSMTDFYGSWKSHSNGRPRRECGRVV